MGSFLTNYQVRADSEDNILRELQQIIRSRAHVSRSKNGWVSVYDETSESQDLAELHRVAKEISARLSCATFAFMVHDSDVLVYLLYERGKLLDEYNSKPDYFGSVDDAERLRYGGKTEIVLKYCGSGTQLKSVEEALHAGRDDDGGSGIAEERLSVLAGFLGIDEDRACISFESVTEESLANTYDFELIHGSSTAKPAKSLLPSADQVLAAIKKLSPEKLALLLKDARAARKLLKLAVYAGDTESVRLFIKAGVWVDDRHAYGTTVLMIAAGLGKLEVVRALIEAGADANLESDVGGTTALIEAISGRHKDIVKLLIEAGANVNDRSGKTLTPLSVAVGRNDTEIAQLLRGAGAA